MHIVIDNSGSMRDNGKSMLAVSTVSIMRKYIPRDIKIDIWGWNAAIIPIDSPAKLTFSGSTDEEALLDFADRIGDERVVLIGDGILDPSIRRSLRKSGWSYIAVGCDSNIDELKNIFGKNHVFIWADSMTCIKMLLLESMLE